MASSCADLAQAARQRTSWRLRSCCTGQAGRSRCPHSWCQPHKRYFLLQLLWSVLPESCSSSASVHNIAQFMMKEVCCLVLILVRRLMLAAEGRPVQLAYGRVWRQGGAANFCRAAGCWNWLLLYYTGAERLTIAGVGRPVRLACGRMRGQDGSPDL